MVSSLPPTNEENETRGGLILLRLLKKHLAVKIEQVKDPSLNREITLIEKIFDSSGYIAQHKAEYDQAESDRANM